MKTIFIYISLIVLITASCNAQKIQDGLEINKISNKDGSISVMFKEILPSYPDKIDPKSADGERVDVVITDFNSRVKVNKIESLIFTASEIKQLNKLRCAAGCQISTYNGRIVEIYIIFNGDPVVDTKKLAEFAKLLREQITFKLEFSKEVETHGYFKQFFPVFISLSIPENKKQKD